MEPVGGEHLAGRGRELRPEQVAEGDRPAAGLHDRDCLDGGKLAAEMTCATAQGVTSTMTLDGSATSDSTSMTMDIRQKAAMIPGGEMRMKMKMNSQRTGDCP